MAPSVARRGELHPLALAGGIVVLVAVFLPWLSSQAGGGNALEVPLPVLWSLNPSDSAMKLGMLLLVLGAAGAGLSFVPRTSPIRRIIGLVVVVMAVAYIVQIFRAVDSLGGDLGDTLDVLGVAAYVTIVGGALLTSSR